MNITREARDEKMIVRCTGRLDATTSVQLEKEINDLIDQGKKEIRLDFNLVDYLSSAGMRVLLSVSKRLKTNSGKLGIFAIHEDVMEIIRIAGFENILLIFPDEVSALGK